MATSPRSVSAKLGVQGHATVHALDAPASFEPELAALAGVRVERAVGGAVTFAIAFVTTRARLDALASALVAAADGDARLWFAYPKGSSKRYTCEFNRDTGWDVLGAAGYEPVSQVSIDEDWTALRFRKVEFIGVMTRSKLAPISAAGQAKARASSARATPRAKAAAKSSRRPRG